MINFNRFILPSTAIGKVYREQFKMFCEMYAPGEDFNQLYAEFKGDKYERDVAKKMLSVFRHIQQAEPELIKLFMGYMRHDTPALIGSCNSFQIKNAVERILAYYDVEAVGLDKFKILVYDRCIERGYIFNFYRRRFSLSSPRYKELIALGLSSAPAAFFKCFIEQTLLDMATMLAYDIFSAISGEDVLFSVNTYVVEGVIQVKFTSTTESAEDTIAQVGNIITSYLGFGLDCELDSAISNHADQQRENGEHAEILRPQ